MKEQETYKHLDIHVRGIVQGVCFRAATRAQAQTLGVRGFVRNEADGSVYIEAEGEPASLGRLVEWCHRGPPGAEVEAVDTEQGAVKNHAGFTVKW